MKCHTTANISIIAFASICNRNGTEINIKRLEMCISVIRTQIHSHNSWSLFSFDVSADWIIPNGQCSECRVSNVGWLQFSPRIYYGTILPNAFEGHLTPFERRIHRFTTRNLCFCIWVVIGCGFIRISRKAIRRTNQKKKRNNSMCAVPKTDVESFVWLKKNIIRIQWIS